MWPACDDDQGCLPADCTHLIMQVVLSTTAVALHPDALQQHASTPIALHPLLEEDATNPLWLTVLFLSFSLHIMLLVLHKSGKPYVLALQSPLLCHYCCVISHIIEQQDIVSRGVLSSAMYMHTHLYISKQNAWSTPELPYFRFQCNGHMCHPRWANAKCAYLTPERDICY